MIEIYIESCTDEDGGYWKNCKHKIEYEEESWLERCLKTYCVKNGYYSLCLSDGRQWDIYNGFRYKATNPKPQTVEISLEDAKKIYGVLNYEDVGLSCYRLGDAISKAEGKDTLGDCLKRDDEDFRKTLKDASPVMPMSGINLHLTPTAQAELARIATIKEPDTAIQDQVNELRYISNVHTDKITDITNVLIGIKDTISQLQRVIDGMKVK